MKRIQAFFTLQRSRRRLFVEALALSVITGIGTSILSFSRMVSFVEYVRGTAERDVSHADVRWATTVAGNQLPNSTCLSRAIVAYALCRRYGHPSTIYVGVDRDADEFLAHSWVMSNGEVVIGDEAGLSSYETLGVIAS